MRELIGVIWSRCSPTVTLSEPGGRYRIRRFDSIYGGSVRGRGVALSIIDGLFHGDKTPMTSNGVLLPYSGQITAAPTVTRLPAGGPAVVRSGRNQPASNPRSDRKQ